MERRCIKWANIEAHFSLPQSWGAQKQQHNGFVAWQLDFFFFRQIVMCLLKVYVAEKLRKSTIIFVKKSDACWEVKFYYFILWKWIIEMINNSRMQINMIYDLEFHCFDSVSYKIQIRLVTY